MADLAKRHLFRYLEDPADELARKLHRPPPLRPVVPVKLSLVDRWTPTAVAIVDSGSERTLAAPSWARVLNVDLSQAIEGTIGIGGDTRAVAFTTVHLTLYSELFVEDQVPLAEWDAEVGFLTKWTPTWSVLLGQSGFFDEFTATMHRSAHALMLEPWEAFDQRFGVDVEEADTAQPRFRP